MSEPIKIAYLDLDGVLVDFVGGLLRFHNSKSLSYKHVEWDIDKQLGLSRKACFGTLDSDFWSELEWTREGAEILAMVEHYFENNFLLMTALPPFQKEAAIAGKLRWIKEHIPQHLNKLVLCHGKNLFASPDKLLIDDKDSNLEEFLIAGGSVAPIGRPWNRYRNEEDDLLSRLHEDIESFLA